MCFVDLEKAFDRVPRGNSVGVLQRVWGPGAFAKGCSVSVRPEQELGSHCRQVGGEVLPQVEEFKYLGVLFTSEGKIESVRLTGGLVQRPCSYAVGVPDRRGEEGAESKSEALEALPVNPVNPTLPPSPMVMNFG
ncbi:hypothetical protein L3Q82_014284 [Scortum barcoo]|uniref:Uncharacterized protein n=1 Tax=Scortum barcoo TaxID=214431 RepID=A0ACB8VZI0_9TELE|nr:hypothetical protein L3Q82_014284 [Scortum barcoo]